MDGKQDFDFVDDDARDIGIFWIFSRYILPYLLGFILIGIIYFIAKDILNDINIELNPQDFGIVAVILILILILAISR